MKKNIIIIILSVVMIGLLVSKCRKEPIREVTKIVIDTVYVHDTIRIDNPVHTKVIEMRDTLVVPIRDTMRLRDTLYMNLPLEKRVYKRDEFYAEVTGYNPRLTHIEIYSKDKVVSKKETTIVQPSNWRFALDCGVDFGKMVHPYAAPNIGAEMSYKRWSIGVEGGMNMDVVGGVFQAPKFYYQMGVRYRIAGN